MAYLQNLTDLERATWAAGWQRGTRFKKTRRIDLTAIPRDPLQKVSFMQGMADALIGRPRIFSGPSPEPAPRWIDSGPASR